MSDFPFDIPQGIRNGDAADLKSITFPDGTTQDSAADLSNYVDKSSNQSIDGQITFTSGVKTSSVIARTSSGVSLVNNAGSHGLTVYNNGNVGINLSSGQTPNACLAIDYTNSDTSPVGSGQLRYIIENSAGVNQSGVESHAQVGVWTNGRIVTTKAIGSTSGNFTASDMRIKSDVRDVSNGEAIEKLKQLKPKRYGYVDKVERGNTEVYGFIAQEVAEVLPESIMKDTDYMPTIYKVFDLSGTTINCNDSSNNSLYDVSNAELDDKLLLYDENNKKHMVKVSGVDTSLNTIQIDKTINGSKVFAYGKEEDDFHFIKKDHIWTLTTASVIEMLEKIETLEARLTALETQ